MNTELLWIIVMPALMAIGVLAICIPMHRAARKDWAARRRSSSSRRAALEEWRKPFDAQR